MKFKNSDEAWAFCLSCGGQKGFEIRKRYTNKRSADGKLIGLQLSTRTAWHSRPLPWRWVCRSSTWGCCARMPRCSSRATTRGGRRTGRPWTSMAGGGHVAHVALVALYPGRRRPQGLRLHVFPGHLRHGGSRDVLLGIPATADSEGSLCTCCFVSRPPLTTRAPASRVALRPPLLWRQ